MKCTIVRYRIKPDHVGENEALIKNVFEQLQNASPGGLQYASFKADDGVSFTHVAIVTTADGNNPLTALDAFKAFAKDIADRCDEKPVATDVAPVGSYNLVG